MHFAHKAIVYCYIEFKLNYFKNLKLFSIRVKELFEHIVFVKKRRRVLTLSKTDLLVTLGDFALKNAKLGREICIKIKVHRVETNFAVWKIITII